MTSSTEEAPKLPPDVARYLQGAARENLQFDFLIGDWEVDATRFGEGGAVVAGYKGGWYARYLNSKRMVMDDYKVYAPTGQVISSYVTLRTYSDITRRWEMCGLSALKPAMKAEWSGEWQNGEMLIDAIGHSPEGNVFRNKIRFFDIEPDRFRWESRVSVDDGRNWMRVVSLIATRTSP